ncbi:MAG: cobalamin-dependent protein [Planctomycetota bacterium]
MRIDFVSATYTTPHTFSRKFLGIGYVHAYAAADPELNGKCDFFHHLIDYRETDWEVIAREVLEWEPDLVGFACYIWNTPAVLGIARLIKKLKPEVKITLGGPEVSYDHVGTLERNPWVDYVVVNEGEMTFAELAKSLLNGTPSLMEVQGITFRDESGKVVANPPRPFEKNLDLLPSPYLSGVLELDPVIGGANFQTSRGCPFTCTYCDYGRNQPYFQFSMDRMRAEFEFFKKHGATALYCVDSTFNLRRERCNEILQTAVDIGLDSWLMCEVFPSLINDELVELFGKMKGCIVNVGIQTTSPVAMKNIRRVWKPEEVTERLDKIARLPNAYLGIETIMGLPGDTLESFKHMINWSYERKPQNIFAFKLQILPRTPMEQEIEKFGIVYHDQESGKEIVSTYTMSKEDILVGKAICEWHQLFQVMFYRLTSITRKSPADLIEQWAYKTYYAGYYDRIAEYLSNQVADEDFEPLRNLFREFCDEILEGDGRNGQSRKLADLFHYLNLRWANTQQGTTVTEMLDIVSTVSPQEDHQIHSIAAPDLAVEPEAPAERVPELLTKIRKETLCCDMRKAWSVFSLDDLNALPMEETNYVICTEPVTGAGRAIIVDDCGLAVLDRIDRRRSLAQIAAELEPEFGPDCLDRVRRIYDQLEQSGFARDINAETPHRFQVNIYKPRRVP